MLKLNYQTSNKSKKLTIKQFICYFLNYVNNKQIKEAGKVYSLQTEKLISYARKIKPDSKFSETHISYYINYFNNKKNQEFINNLIKTNELLINKFMKINKVKLDDLLKPE